MIFFFCPILGATLIAGALTIDEFHNWYDVLAGAVIGTSTALVAFRQTFASIWDFRFNHIPLPRTTSFFHRHPNLSSGPVLPSGFAPGGPFFTYHPYATEGGLATWMSPVTRDGGWGSGAEGRFGAPFDASAMISGGVGNMLGDQGLRSGGLSGTHDGYGGRRHGHLSGDRAV